MKKIREFHNLEDIVSRDVLDYLEDFRKRMLEKARNGEPELQDFRISLISFLLNENFMDTALEVFCNTISEGNSFSDDIEFLHAMFLSC